MDQAVSASSDATPIVPEFNAWLEHLVNSGLAAIGGSVSAEHGIGLEKKDYLPFSRSAAEIEVMRKLKRMLDPRNILNRGRVVDV